MSCLQALNYYRSFLTSSRAMIGWSMIYREVWIFGRIEKTGQTRTRKWNKVWSEPLNVYLLSEAYWAIFSRVRAARNLVGLAYKAAFGMSTTTHVPFFPFFLFMLFPLLLFSPLYQSASYFSVLFYQFPISLISTFKYVYRLYLTDAFDSENVYGVSKSGTLHDFT